jgi:hypothetical protein
MMQRSVDGVDGRRPAASRVGIRPWNSVVTSNKRRREGRSSGVRGGPAGMRRKARSGRT